MSLKGKEKVLAILHRYMEIHGTVYYETQRPPEVPAFVKNHGLLPQQELQQLLRKAKVGTWLKLSWAQNRLRCLYTSFQSLYSNALLEFWGVCEVNCVLCEWIWAAQCVVLWSSPFSVKLFIGFGFPYEGPAPLEAIANGCIFLQPKFDPPHSSLNHEFFRGKPTSREVFTLHVWIMWWLTTLLQNSKKVIYCNVSSHIQEF